jgi:proteasome accessory factor C
MTASAAAQLRRLLALIPECADDRPQGLADLAARAGTDPATLLRDVRALSERFDDPAGFVEAVQIFVEPDRLQVRSDHFLRPMRLTLAELGALDLGLALLEAERPPEERPALRGARERLEAAMARLPGDDVDAGLRHAEVPAGDPAVLAALRQAYRASRRVRLRYRRAGAAEATDREVSPFAIVFTSGHWYVAGPAADSEEIRVFRVDRVEEVEVLPQRYRIPAGFDPASVFRDGRAFTSDVATRVRIRFSSRVARWVAEREGGAPAADGSFVLERPLADLDWLVRYVAQYGPEAEVIEPSEARDAARRGLAAMLAALSPAAA